MIEPPIATPSTNGAASPMITHSRNVRSMKLIVGSSIRSRRVAVLLAALRVQEQPAEVGVREAAQRARRPWPWSTCGECGSPGTSVKAWCLRWSATQEITGPSIAIDPNAANVARTHLFALNARWVR